MSPWGRVRVAGVVVLALALVIVGLGVTGFLAYRERADHERAIAQLRAQEAALRPLDLMIADAATREIQRRLDIMGRVAKHQGVPVTVMKGVFGAVPEGIRLSSLELRPREVMVPASAGSAERRFTEIKGYSVVIRAVAFKNAGVAGFMENLRKGGLLSNLDFTVTSATKGVLEFEVTAQVRT